MLCFGNCGRAYGCPAGKTVFEISVCKGVICVCGVAPFKLRAGETGAGKSVGTEVNPDGGFFG